VQKIRGSQTNSATVSNESSSIASASSSLSSSSGTLGYFAPEVTDDVGQIAPEELVGVLVVRRNCLGPVEDRHALFVDEDVVLAQASAWTYPLRVRARDLREQEIENAQDLLVLESGLGKLDAVHFLHHDGVAVLADRLWHRDIGIEFLEDAVFALGGLSGGVHPGDVVVLRCVIALLVDLPEVRIALAVILQRQWLVRLDLVDVALLADAQRRAELGNDVLSDERSQGQGIVALELEGVPLVLDRLLLDQSALETAPESIL